MLSVWTCTSCVIAHWTQKLSCVASCTPYPVCCCAHRFESEKSNRKWVYRAKLEPQQQTPADVPFTSFVSSSIDKTAVSKKHWSYVTFVNLNDRKPGQCKRINASICNLESVALQRQQRKALSPSPSTQLKYLAENMKGQLCFAKSRIYWW